MKGSKGIGILLLFFFLIHGGFSQTIQFEKVYGGLQKDEPKAVLQTYDNGYLVAGGSSNYGVNAPQGFLYKFDSLGNPVWNKGYGGDGVENLTTLTRSKDSGYVAAGITTSHVSGDYQIFLLKVDTLGDTVWTRSFGGKDWDLPRAMKTLEDSSFIIGGSTFSNTKGGSDLFLMKVSKAGDSLWTRTYGDKKRDELFDLTITDEKGFLLVGEKTDTAFEDTTRSYFIKTDSIGDPIWDTTHTIRGRSYCASVLTEDNGEFVGIIDYWADSSGSDQDISIFRMDTSGTMIWRREFTPSPTKLDIGMKVIKAFGGGYLISGFTNSAGNGKKDIWFFKTTPSGYFDWNYTYGDDQHESTMNVIATQDSGYFTAGPTESYGNSQKNIYILKTDRNGISSGNVVISLEEQRKKDQLSVSIHPNPAKDRIYVHTTGKLDGESSLQIFNSQGQLVMKDRLTEQKNRIGIERLTPGVYIVLLNPAKGSPIRRKLIVQD